MTTPWQRCFIALTPCQQARDRLAALPVDPRARRVAAADLHLTLAFLGGLSDSQRNELGEVLPALASPLPDLTFTGLEIWPSLQRARVQVATFALPGALDELVQRLNPILVDMGLPVDSRPFRPHVTLARFAHGRSASDPDRDASLPECAARFEAISLYARAPAQESVRYQALASQALPSPSSPAPVT
jgi:2'-5' RNA ligase